MRALLPLLGLFLALTAPAEAFAEEQGRLDRALGVLASNTSTIDDDLRALALYPYDHPQESGMALLGVGVAVALDKPLTRYRQDKIEPLFKGFKVDPPRFANGHYGFNGPDTYLILTMAGTYGYGLLADDPTAQAAGAMAIKASAYSILVSHLILKPLIGRKRPVSNLSSAQGDQGEFTTNPYSFGHGSRPKMGSFLGGSGMPSFHFTEFFAVARVYHKVYDNALIPYSLCAAGLLANITSHKHWVGDMVAGSLIGTAIGSVVADNMLPAAESAVGAASATLWLPEVGSQAIAMNVVGAF